MKKQNLGARRILALLLGAVMIFTSVDAEVLAAEDSRIDELTEAVNSADYGIGINETDSSEISSEITGESDADDVAADNKDTIEKSGTEDGGAAAGESGEDDGSAPSDDNSGESTGAAGESAETDGADTTGEPEPADAGESMEDAAVSENDADENEAVPDIEMQQSRETMLSAYGELISENRVNNITYKYYKNSSDSSTTLYIEGTGDYTRKGYENPPWSDRSFDLAVVKIKGITSTKNMFYNCQQLKTVDLSGLDTSQVTDMSGMFAVGGEQIGYDEGSMYVLGRLEELDLSALDTSKVTNMSRMFSYCGALRKLNISGWDTGRVTDMSHMFEYCTELGLTSAGLANLNTSNVTNMDSMFKFYAYNRRQLAAVETLDLSRFNTAKVRNMSGMFESCSYIHNLDVRSFDTCNVINMSRMFYDCVNIENMDISGFDTSKVTDMSEMFYRCKAQDVRNFDTSNVTDMSRMFQKCGVTIRDTIDVSHFDTGKVTDMSGMFDHASIYMRTLDVSNFDTSNVTDMSDMFAGLTNLEGLDVSGFDTAKAENMENMFDGCKTLKALDVSKFNTSGVSSMAHMFRGCEALASLDVSGFETVNVNYMTDMFSNCVALGGLDLSSFDMSNTGNSFPLITGCNALSYICTPKNCALNVPLPDGKWYSEDAAEYTSLPTALSESIILYKGGYPGDDKGETKQLLFISGITLTNKIYDARPVSYMGTAVVTDSKGNEIPGAVLLPSYSGILTDGSAYGATAAAPVQAGSYKLSFDVSGIDESKYIISKTSYNFRIARKTVTITAPSCEVEIGGTVPGLSGLTCEVNELMENDSDALAVQPSLKYSQDAASIPVDIVGSYDIIPYGAQLSETVAGNYSIRYVRGKLKIGQPSEDDDLIAGGTTTYGVTWKITEVGKLILEGDGEYTTVNGIDKEITPPWCADKWRNKILSAEVRVSGITRVQYMFAGCKNLKTIDLSGLDTDNVTRMHHMFDGCSSLKSLDLTGFNTSSVTSMNGMFIDCRSLESLDLSGFDTRNVRYMGYHADSGQGMFENCSSLKKLDLGSFNTGNVTDMSGMFENCSSLKNLDLSSFDTTKVKYMGFYLAFKDRRGMFSGCSSLESLDLSNFNTANVIDMSGMFSGCSALTGLDLRRFDMSSITEDAVNMLDNCTALSYILTPANCAAGVALPIAESTDKWTDKDGLPYTELPQNLKESIILYKNAYKEEGGIEKQIVFISGISVQSKVYDKKPAPCTGTAKVTDTEGKTLDLPLRLFYAGTLADNSFYPESENAPTQAGTYTLYVEIEGADADKYIIHKDSFPYYIRQREITVTAPSVRIEIGGEAPEPAELTCEVNGFLDEDRQPDVEPLVGTPTLKYSAGIQDIDTSKSGKYYIIPYGVVLNEAFANNYRIRYERGTLTVGDPDDDSPYDDAERVDLSGQALNATIANIKPKTYDGYAYEPAVKVTVVENGKKKVLTEGLDYRLDYQNNINAGTGTVIVKGNGEYNGELTKDFTIKPKSVNKLKYIIGSMSVGDDGANPPIYVYDGPKLLQKGTDYTLSGTENLTAQPSKGVTVTVKGSADSVGTGGSTAGTGKDVTATVNYMGSKKIKIAVYEGDASKIIKPDNIYWGTDNTSMLYGSYSQAYTGKAIKPEVTVKIGGTDLEKGRNYKIQYQNNKNAGTAYVIITGKGEYKGKVVTTFEITPLNIGDAAQNPVIKTIADKTYNARLQKPSVSLTIGDKALKTFKTLKKNRDYTLSYKNNLHAGTATVTVKGKGNYSGSAQQTFSIKPQNIKKVSVKGTHDGGLAITYAKGRLKENIHYTLQYGEINKNKIAVTITAKEGGDFTGSVTKQVKLK